MPLVANGRNVVLDALDETQTRGAKYVSLHSAYSAVGANEITGGSPAYARQAATWDAGSASSKPLNADLTFDVPAGSISWIGYWDAVTSGTFLGMSPNGSSAPKVFVMPDATADVCYCIAQGFANDTSVVVAGDNLPTGLTEGEVYYIVGSAANAFQLAATSGGAAIDLSGVGQGTVQKVVIETFAAQGQFTVKATTTAFSGNIV